MPPDLRGTDPWTVLARRLSRAGSSVGLASGAMAERAPLSVHEPEGEPRGGIVVIQEAFGVNEHIEDIGRRLAAEGWLAVIPHLFHRTGDPQIPYDDFAAV